MGVNSLHNTVTRQRRDCDLNSGPSALESSTLPSHPSERSELFFGTELFLAYTSSCFETIRNCRIYCGADISAGNLD